MIIMYRKITAVFTTLCFLFAFVLAPALHAAAEISTGQKQFRQILDDFVIPHSTGRITTGCFHGADRVIVNIQDLHCHPEVQRNISRILELFDQKYTVKHVFVEGAAGAIDTSWLGDIKDRDLKKEIVETMVEQGKLTGAEYYSISSGKPGLLSGLEDDDLYRDNLVRLKTILDRKPDYDHALEMLRGELDGLKSAHFGSKNVKLDKVIRKYRAGDMDGERFYRLLLKHAATLNDASYGFGNVASIDLSSYRHINAYLELVQDGRAINYRAVSRQLQEFTGLLKQKLPYAAYNFLLAKTDNFSRMDELTIYLARIAREYNLDLTSNYPELNTFFAYVEKNQSINPIELIREEKKLIEEVRTGLSRDVTELEVAFLADSFSYFEDFLYNRLSAEDYSYFSERFSEFRTLWAKHAGVAGMARLEKDFDLLTMYYQVNLQRNQSFLKNLLADQRPEGAGPRTCSSTRSPYAGRPQGDAPTVVGGASSPTGSDVSRVVAALDEGAEVTIVITGGFHTDGLERLLDEQNISHIAVTPNVTRDTKSSDIVYRELARQQARILSESLAPMLASLLARKAAVAGEDPAAASTRGLLLKEMLEVASSRLKDPYAIAGRARELASSVGFLSGYEITPIEDTRTGVWRVLFHKGKESHVLEIGTDGAVRYASDARASGIKNAVRTTWRSLFRRSAVFSVTAAASTFSAYLDILLKEALDPFETIQLFYAVVGDSHGLADEFKDLAGDLEGLELVRYVNGKIHFDSRLMKCLDRSAQLMTLIHARKHQDFKDVCAANQQLAVMAAAAPWLEPLYISVGSLFSVSEHTTVVQRPHEVQQQRISGERTETREKVIRLQTKNGKAFELRLRPTGRYQIWVDDKRLRDSEVMFGTTDDGRAISVDMIYVAKDKDGMWLNAGMGSAILEYIAQKAVREGKGLRVIQTQNYGLMQLIARKFSSAARYYFENANCLFSEKDWLDEFGPVTVQLWVNGRPSGHVIYRTQKGIPQLKLIAGTSRLAKDIITERDDQGRVSTRWRDPSAHQGEDLQSQVYLGKSLPHIDIAPDDLAAGNAENTGAKLSLPGQPDEKGAKVKLSTSGRASPDSFGVTIQYEDLAETIRNWNSRRARMKQRSTEGNTRAELEKKKSDLEWIRKNRTDISDEKKRQVELTLEDTLRQLAALDRLDEPARLDDAFGKFSSVFDLLKQTGAILPQIEAGLSSSSEILVRFEPYYLNDPRALASAHTESGRLVITLYNAAVGLEEDTAVVRLLIHETSHLWWRSMPAAQRTALISALRPFLRSDTAAGYGYTSHNLSDEDELFAALNGQLRTNGLALVRTAADSHDEVYRSAVRAVLAMNIIDAGSTSEKQRLRTGGKGRPFNLRSGPTRHMAEILEAMDAAHRAHVSTDTAWDELYDIFVNDGPPSTSAAGLATSVQRDTINKQVRPRLTREQTNEALERFFNFIGWKNPPKAVYQTAVAIYELPLLVRLTVGYVFKYRWTGMAGWQAMEGWIDDHGLKQTMDERENRVVGTLEIMRATVTGSLIGLALVAASAILPAYQYIVPAIVAAMAITAAMNIRVHIGHNQEERQFNRHSATAQVEHEPRVAIVYMRLAAAVGIVISVLAAQPYIGQTGAAVALAAALTAVVYQVGQTGMRGRMVAVLHAFAASIPGGMQPVFAVVDATGQLWWNNSAYHRDEGNKGPGILNISGSEHHVAVIERHKSMVLPVAGRPGTGFSKTKGGIIVPDVGNVTDVSQNDYEEKRGLYIPVNGGNKQIIIPQTRQDEAGKLVANIEKSVVSISSLRSAMDVVGRDEELLNHLSNLMFLNGMDVHADRNVLMNRIITTILAHARHADIVEAGYKTVKVLTSEKYSYSTAELSILMMVISRLKDYDSEFTHDIIINQVTERLDELNGHDYLNYLEIIKNMPRDRSVKGISSLPDNMTFGIELEIGVFKKDGTKGVPHTSKIAAIEAGLKNLVNDELRSYGWNVDMDGDMVEIRTGEGGSPNSEEGFEVLRQGLKKIGLRIAESYLSQGVEEGEKVVVNPHVHIGNPKKDDTRAITALMYIGKSMEYVWSKIGSLQDNIKVFDKRNLFGGVQNAKLKTPYYLDTDHGTVHFYFPQTDLVFFAQSEAYFARMKAMIGAAMNIVNAAATRSETFSVLKTGLPVYQRQKLDEAGRQRLVKHIQNLYGTNTEGIVSLLQLMIDMKRAPVEGDSGIDREVDIENDYEEAGYGRLYDIHHRAGGWETRDVRKLVRQEIENISRHGSREDYKKEVKEICNNFRNEPWAVELLRWMLGNNKIAVEDTYIWMAKDTQSSALTLFPGGRLFAVYDEHTRMWAVTDMETGRVVWKFEYKGDGLKFSSDGKLVAIKESDSMWTVKDMDSGQTVPGLNGRMILFSPNGKQVALHNDDRWVVKDVETGKEVPALDGTKGKIVFTSDDNKKVAARLILVYDEHKKMWVVTDVENGQAVQVFEGYLDDIVFSPNGKLLAYRESDSMWIVKDVVSGKTVGELAGENIHFSPDNKLVAVKENDSMWIVKRVESGETVPGLAGEYMSFSPDNKLVAVKENDSMCIVKDVERGQTVPGLAGEYVDFSPDGKLVAVRDGRISTVYKRESILTQAKGMNKDKSMSAVALTREKTRAALERFFNFIGWKNPPKAVYQTAVAIYELPFLVRLTVEYVFKYRWTGMAGWQAMEGWIDDHGLKQTMDERENRVVGTLEIMRATVTGSLIGLALVAASCIVPVPQFVVPAIVAALAVTVGANIREHMRWNAPAAPDAGAMQVSLKELSDTDREQYYTQILELNRVINWDDIRVKSGIHREYYSPGTLCWVALDVHGKVVGYAVARPQIRYAMSLSYLAVDPRVQSSGIASQLFDAFHAKAIEVGSRSISLDCDEELVGFYTKLLSKYDAYGSIEVVPARANRVTMGMRLSDGNPVKSGMVNDQNAFMDLCFRFLKPLQAIGLLGRFAAGKDRWDVLKKTSLISIVEDPAEAVAAQRSLSAQGIAGLVIAPLTDATDVSALKTLILRVNGVELTLKSDAQNSLLYVPGGVEGYAVRAAALSLMINDNRRLRRDLGLPSSSGSLFSIGSSELFLQLKTAGLVPGGNYAVNARAASMSWKESKGVDLFYDGLFRQPASVLMVLFDNVTRRSRRERLIKGQDMTLTLSWKFVSAALATEDGRRMFSGIVGRMQAANIRLLDVPAGLSRELWQKTVETLKADGLKVLGKVVVRGALDKAASQKIVEQLIAARSGADGRYNGMELDLSATVASAQEIAAWLNDIARQRPQARLTVVLPRLVSVDQLQPLLRDGIAITADAATLGTGTGKCLKVTAEKGFDLVRLIEQVKSGEADMVEIVMRTDVLNAETIGRLADSVRDIINNPRTIYETALQSDSVSGIGAYRDLIRSLMLRYGLTVTSGEFRSAAVLLGDKAGQFLDDVAAGVKNLKKPSDISLRNDLEELLADRGTTPQSRQECASRVLALLKGSGETILVRDYLESHDMKGFDSDEDRIAFGRARWAMDEAAGRYAGQSPEAIASACGTNTDSWLSAIRSLRAAGDQSTADAVLSKMRETVLVHTELASAYALLNAGGETVDAQILALISSRADTLIVKMRRYLITGEYADEMGTILAQVQSGSFSEQEDLIVCAQACVRYGDLSYEDTLRLLNSIKDRLAQLTDTKDPISFAGMFSVLELLANERLKIDRSSKTRVLDLRSMTALLGAA